MPRPLGPAARPKQTPVSSLAREPLKTYEHLTRGGSQFTTPIAPGKKIKEWETLVLFAVNLSRLDVMVNMSNVMGNTVYVSSSSTLSVTVFFSVCFTCVCDTDFQVVDKRLEVSGTTVNRQQR